MISFSQFKQIKEAVQSMDPQFTDDVIQKAEYYDIEEDKITLQTIVTVYDANGAVLATVNVDDYETALYYLEEIFDLEPIEDDDIDKDAAAGASRFGS